MKKLMLLAAALAGLTTPVSAQYYGGGGYYAPPPPPPQAYDPYGRPYRGYGYPPPAPDYGYGYRQPLGRFCETGRGSCYTRPSPLGAPCRCDIPGFGLKRGIVQ